jgi:cytoskeleton protein RodZ
VSVGEQLTAARVQAGLSIDDVSAATRIRPGLLTAMEDNDFSRCGGNFYARGHIRSIARVLKVDPEPLLSEYDAAHAAPEPSRGRSNELADPGRLATVHPARPRWAVVMGAILVGLLGWGMVRLFTLPSDVEATASPSTSPPLVSTSTPAAAPRPSTPGPSATSRVSPVKPGSVPKTVRVTIEAVGVGTYVRLRNINGLRLFSGTLRGGSAHSLTYGGRLDVMLGVPKNVRIYVNGTRIYPKAARFIVTLTGTVQKPR